MFINLLVATSSTAIPYPDYSDVWKERPIVSSDVSTKSTFYSIKSSELNLLGSMWPNYTGNEKSFILGERKCTNLNIFLKL